MLNCINCKKPTDSIVREPNICKDIPLCEECKKEFRQCSACRGHYYPKDLKDGKCDNCQDTVNYIRKEDKP